MQQQQRQQQQQQQQQQLQKQDQQQIRSRDRIHAADPAAQGQQNGQGPQARKGQGNVDGDG
jgi:hypothetical protein